MVRITYKKIKITDENRKSYSDYRDRYKLLGPSGLIYISLSGLEDGFCRRVRLSDEYIHEFSTLDWHILMEFEDGIKHQIGITDEWLEAFVQALAI